MSGKNVKVTVNPTPSEQVMAKSEEITTTDSRGRIIKLKKPGVLAQYRLVEMMGDSAKNEVYMGMVLPVVFVCEIDGDAVPFPMSKSEVEALIQRLDEDGLAAVMKAMEESFGKQNPEADKAALKK